MEISTPKFKAASVSIGLSLWFFVITSGIGYFSLERFIIFIVIAFSVTQIFANKISKGLDVFAIFNTKIFLAVLFISVVSIYGFFFKILKIDLLRLKNEPTSYWLNVEQLKEPQIYKQY